MKAVFIGQTVELRGRQGFVTSLLEKYEICVWFLCPPNGKKSRFCWVDVKDLEEKPDLEPLRIEHPEERVQ